MKNLKLLDAFIRIEALNFEHESDRPILGVVVSSLDWLKATFGGRNIDDISFDEVIDTWMERTKQAIIVEK